MKKFIAFDGEHWIGKYFVRGERRMKSWEMQENSMQPEYEAHRNTAYTWALKIGSCIFAEIIFAEMFTVMQVTMQMMVRMPDAERKVMQERT
jgi:hypothetical protein